MSVAQYAYLNTRVSLYAAQLLGMDRLDSLIDRPYDEDAQAASPLSDSLDKTTSQSTRLHQTAAKSLVIPQAGERGKVSLREFHINTAAQYAGDLDQSNVTLLLKELAVLIRPLSGAPRELLGYWAHRFELGNLKTIIRGKMANQPQAAIEAQLQDMGAFTSLPIAGLLQSDTPAELLRRLEQTPYAEIARQARHLLEQGEALFALDAALDRRYFAGLARRGAAIEGGAGQLLRAIVGSIVDRVNLVWLLRYRYAYNLPPAQAYYLLIPASHRLLPQQLQQLAQCANFEDAIASLPSPFDRILADARNTTEVTLKLERETWRYANHALRHNSFNAARAFAYMMLRERDLRRLRAIVRGRDMHMEPAMIRTALGLVNGHGKCAAPDDEICHARSPHLNPLPQAGEEENESLREFHVKNGQETH